MRLIIAEKPSMGRTIAAAVGADRRKSEDFLEGSGYIVTWCYGHMYELCEPEEYVGRSGEKVSWRDSMSYMPVLPDGFRYRARTGCREQLQVLEDLLNRSDVDTVYAAGDADREGEVIVGMVIEKLMKGKKKVLRLWTSSLTESAILDAIRDAEPDSRYRDLYDAGRARAAVDWMLGIDLTRYASVKAGTTLRVGRCICPIVERITQREKEIKGFVPERYIVAEGRVKKGDGELVLTSEKRFTPDMIGSAQKYCDALNREQTIVEEVSTARRTVRPPKLFSLSDLQSAACKRDKSLKPADVLESAQRLYEQGYISYPRTNSSYLCEDEHGKVERILEAFRRGGAVQIADRKDKGVYDDSKVESHSALIPTEKIPAGLAGRDGTIYGVIKDRFLAVFCSEPCLMDRTQAKITCGPETFRPKGDVLVQKGWQMYEAPASKEKPLIPLAKGEVLYPSYALKEKETEPPKRYTVESLNRWMNAPFRGDDADREEYTDEEWADILSEATICTEATRAGILENCMKYGYISLEKGVYHGQDMGAYLVKVMGELGIDLGAGRTAALSRDLHDISAGRKAAGDVLENTKAVIREVYAEDAAVTESRAGQAAIGKCPRCGKAVIVTPKAYSCEDRSCGFAIWKDNRYFKAIGWRLTDKRVQTLLKDGRVLAKGLKSKKGTTYDAYIVMGDVSGKYPEFRMEFPERRKR